MHGLFCYKRLDNDIKAWYYIEKEQEDFNMRYISNVVGHDKIALVVDFTGVKVSDCTARGVLHKIYQK